MPYFLSLVCFSNVMTKLFPSKWLLKENIFGFLF